MSSQPGIPYEQLPEPPFRVPSQQPKPRAPSIFNPSAEGDPSSSQSNQSSTGAAPANDNTSDGAPGQNRNGGGKVCNIKSPHPDHKTDIASPTGLGRI
jgi:hypothetical protein